MDCIGSRCVASGWDSNSGNGSPQFGEVDLVSFSSDAGEVWEKGSIPSSIVAIGPLTCVTVTTCYVLGVHHVYGNAMLLVSRDGGASWSILSTIPVQLLAYHTAVIKGTDVDQPRNLAKSVTVE